MDNEKDTDQKYYLDIDWAVGYTNFLKQGNNTS